MNYLSNKNMKNPLISIITVVYNNVGSLEETILSIIGQTYKNIEYIIIDGKSTDGTIDVVKKYEDKIAYWISEADGGIYDAMNKGLRNATGDWICFINAGDGLADKNVIQNIYDKSFFRNEQVDVLYGDSVVIYNDLRKKMFYARKPIKYLWKGPVFRHGAMFVRRSLHQAHPFRLDNRYKICADFDLIYHLFVDKFKFLYVDEIIMYFEQDGISNNRIRCAKDNKMVVSFYTPNIVYSVWHNVHILRAYFIDLFIKPILKILSINI